MSNPTAIVIPTMDNPFRSFVINVDEMHLLLIAIFVGISLTSLAIAIIDMKSK